MPTVVIPSLRVGAHNIDAGFSPSHTRNAAATDFSPFARESLESGTAPISTTPSTVTGSIKPGVIHLPVASICSAPAGMTTLAPTAVILALTITTVAFSIGGWGAG